MKRKQDGDMIIRGFERDFKFRILDCDYDFCDAKSISYKYSKRLWQRAMDLKRTHERDFYYCEYDCTGSTEIRIKVYRKRNRMYIRYHERLDV